MMGGVSPETCWASYKYKIKFWYTVASCWIFYMNYTTLSHHGHLAPGIWASCLKNHLARKRFATDTDVKQAVTSWLQTYDNDFFYSGIPRWGKCLNVSGDYAEVWCVPSANDTPPVYWHQNKLLYYCKSGATDGPYWQWRYQMLY